MTLDPVFLEFPCQERGTATGRLEAENSVRSPAFPHSARIPRTRRLVEIPVVLGVGCLTHMQQMSGRRFDTCMSYQVTYEDDEAREGRGKIREQWRH